MREINIIEIKNKIIDNTELIYDILESLNLAKIRDYGKEFRCAPNEDSNATSIVIQKYNLSFIFRHSGGEEKGDIVTLVMYFKKLGFVQAVKYICNIIGMEYSKEVVKTKTLFGGYYKGCKDIASDDISLETFEENVLDKYRDKGNDRFYKDGISFETQTKFKIMYDLDTHRITIPWRNEEGKIIGIAGRINMDHDECKEMGLAKYYPLIKFPKSKALFGFNENYEKIQKYKKIFVGEAEKFSMKLDTWNIKAGAVSVGGHSLSEHQANMIKSCYPDEVILMYDEDVVDEEYLKEQCEKLKYKNNLHICKVGYVIDRENKYLPKGSNMSPSDLTKKEFAKLYKECVVWI